MRLSKLGKVYFSGKQQERVTFQYVFNDKLITCCGDVAERLLWVNGKNGYTEKECEALTIWQGTYIVTMDRGFKSYLLTCIRQDVASGQTFMHEIISNEAAGKMLPGVGGLMRYIMDGTLMSHAEAAVQLMEIKMTSISVNDSAEEMRATCADVRSKWAAIPAKYRGPEEGLSDTLVDLIPNCLKEYKATVKVGLDTRRAMDDPLPTYEQLVAAIVTGVVRHRLDNPMFPTLVAGGGYDMYNNKCFNCGGKHKAWECPKKCTTCGTNFCGAPEGEPDKCPCGKKEMPTNNQVKNIIGKPIPEKLYSVLEAMHKELQAKGPVEAHSLLLTDVWGGVIAPTLSEW